MVKRLDERAGRRTLATDTLSSHEAVRCSFCLRSDDDQHFVGATANPALYICDRCVVAALDMFTAKGVRSPEGKRRERRPLTKRQFDLYRFVADYIAAKTIAPSQDEIAVHFGYRSQATAHEHLRALERKGWIRRTHYQSRGIELLSALPDKPNGTESPR